MTKQPDDFEPRPYALKNKIQNYAWGTAGEKAFIPKFLNEKIEPNTPYAELWIGAHPSAPSEVRIDDFYIPLNRMIEQYPKQILGAEIAAKFDNKLPFLFKVLSAAEALSIQAHPNKIQAVKLHQKDPKHYPDDNHKPEVAVALDSLTALVGFKSVAELKQVMIDYPELVDYLGQESLEVLNNSHNINISGESSIIKNIYTKLMSNSITHERELARALTSLEKRLLNSTVKLTEGERFFLKLKEKYGTDVGLFSIFILKMIHLKTGEGLFLSAGIPHAYLKGNIVECMANSDNVVRAGLTPKFKDVKTLLNILRYDPSQVKIFKPDVRQQKFIYEAGVPEFRLTRCTFPKNYEYNHENVNRPSVYLITDGELLVQWQKDGQVRHQQFYKGQSFLIPACLNRFKISAISNGVYFTVELP
ncbi:mannose-6-phosphate isomerase, class I [candidate division KSB1 bacterium]|nr:mannose-6-phosphate isomerase, class I [candidate division KSB1 bacterium]